MTKLAFDPEAIRTLAAILLESGLTEIEISEKDSRIRVVRAPATVQASLAPTVIAAPAAAVPVEPPDDSHHPGAVLSPMVGIAYLSPEPGAAPFVLPGQQVAAGQTLLLIEAMKTFNQIKSPRAGTVARILITSGAPVEFGEVLLVLDY
jgi:acetyl-CoA carboxylase biotin carboxyl carrier protein